MTPETIKTCALLSRLAYSGQDQIQAWLAKSGLAFTAFLDDKELPSGFIAAQYVVFAGTRKDGPDILTDIDAMLTDVPGHPGYEAHEGFWDRVQTLNTCGRPGWILTGHSLGGALATLEAFCLIVNGTPPESLITFGSPRACNTALADFIFHNLGGDRIRRFVNGLDPVPRMPVPIPGILPFHHVGLPDNLDGTFTDLEALEKEDWAYHRIAGYVEALGV